MFNSYKRKYINLKKCAVLIVLGLIILILSFVVTNDFLKIILGTIASYLLVNCIIEVLNNMYTEQEIINKVCDCINGESDSAKLGVINLKSTMADSSLIEEFLDSTKKELFIMQVYGYGWTSINRKNLIKVLSNKKVRVKVILSNYTDNITMDMYKKQYNGKDVKNKIKDTLKLWKEIYDSSGSNENLEIKLFDGIISNVIYGNEKKIISYSFSSTKDRKLDKMTMLYTKKIDTNDCLYERYLDEFRGVFEESIEFDLNNEFD